MSYRRYNPLLDEWILISPNRIKRPWDGEITNSDSETANTKVSNSSSTKNPLAPGGIRSNGEITPNYTHTFVFPNDFPALNEGNFVEDDDEIIRECSSSVLYQSVRAKGVCRFVFVLFF